MIVKQQSHVIADNVNFYERATLSVFQRRFL